MWSLKDIAVRVRATLDASSVAGVTTELKEALEEGAAQAEGAAKKVGLLDTSFGKLNNTIGRFYAFWIARALVRAVTGFVEESIMAFAKFDQKIQQSIAILDGVTASMRQKMSDQARALSRELNMPAEDLAESYYFLASAGLNAEQSLAAMPAVAAFAKAGMMDLAKATESMTQVQAALGLQSDDAATNLNNLRYVMDVITVAAARSQATIQQFADAFANKAGASLRVFHKDVAEGAAVLAVMADQGVKGRTAGERLDMFLRQATLAATKHADVFKHYGIQVFDATGKIRNMADIVADLTRVLGGMTDQSQVATLAQLGFQVRTVAVVRSLLGMQDRIRDYQKTFEEAGGATDRMAKKQLQTPIEQLGLIGRKFDDVRMEIGEAFIPTLYEMRDALGDETSKFSVINVLHALSKWLYDNADAFGWLGDKIIRFAVGALALLIDTFNLVADGIVVSVNTPLMILTVILEVVTATLYAFTMGIGSLATAIGMTSIGGKLLEFGSQIKKINDELDKFYRGRAGSSLGAIQDGIGRIKSGFGFSPTTPRPSVLGTLGIPTKPPPGASGTDTDDDITGDEKRAKKLEALQDRLTNMILSHTKTQTDNQIQALEKLEREYEAIYGKKIPQIIKDQFQKVRDLIKNESTAEDIADEVKTFIDKVNEDGPTLENVTILKSYITWLKNMRLSTHEGTDAYDKYTVAIKAAEAALAKWQKAVDKAEKDEAAKAKKDKDEEALKRLHRIQRIGVRAADTLASAFGKWIDVLLVGTRRASDAFEQLGRVIAKSMIGALADFFMMKAREDFMKAAEQVAEGFASLGMFDNAGASAHFTAAAKFAAVGALWAAAGGAASGLASSVGNSQHGLSSFEAGRGSVDQFQRQGSDINIFIDGVDPNNPRHQQLLGQTIQQYQQRAGGTIKVSGRKP